MTLRDLKTELLLHPAKSFRIALPEGQAVPSAFHITEVARIRKDFIDCGGRPHAAETCQLQVWIGPDAEHRLTTTKLAAVLRKTGTLFPTDDLPLEIEHECDGRLATYAIQRSESTPQAIILHAEAKHAACLAPDICLPAST
jgi:hypothetical protein